MLTALGSLRGGLEALLVRGEPLPEVDVQIPLLSLPRKFGITLENIPGAAGYLSADQQRAAYWKEILSRDVASMRVGLVWGGRKAPLNADRSMTLYSLEAVLQTPGVLFYSLQQGEDAKQLVRSPSIADLGERLNDFGETAAVIANLDLVITIDTAVAHLAGALGVPVWVMLKYSPDWRWLLDRDDTPWYASARLFRQPAPGDWGPVTQAISDALKKISACKNNIKV